MVSSLHLGPLLLCLAMIGLAQGQFLFPLLFGTEFGETMFDFYGSGQGSYLMMNQLNARLSRLETNVRTGAIGGCESGVVGPLSPLQSTATIQFQGNFLTPPSVSLSLSDLTTASANTSVSVQIRPSQVTSSAVTVTLTDLSTPNNVASAFVSYMACPSNSSPMVGGSTSNNNNNNHHNGHSNGGHMG